MPAPTAEPISPPTTALVPLWLPELYPITDPTKAPVNAPVCVAFEGTASFPVQPERSAATMLRIERVLIL